ncbi:uncharacterized protein LOC142973286, partial [Anticarsia gemmatalis]|uniref:uncharacterized protein LOC142973286 n=1 Tax=Anticarsia gemmatalis TaxID=129554 RepID=UPI003F775AB1
FQVLCVLALAAVAMAKEHAHSSQHISRHDGHATEVKIQDKHGHHHIDYYAYPKYEFEYKVKDPHTHDHKAQHEHRDGDKVKGYYVLDQPDGSERHVDYHADKHTGFQANVKYGTHHHINIFYIFVQVLCLVAMAAAVMSAEHAHSSQHIHRHDGHAQEISVHDKHGHHHVDYYAHPKYDFKYEVKDPHTHDHKSQHEHRDGDEVKGHYSLHQPDGTQRDVHYHSDKKTGFQAEVKHSTHHVVPEKHEHHHHH